MVGFAVIVLQVSYIGRRTVRAHGRHQQAWQQVQVKEEEASRVHQFERIIQFKREAASSSCFRQCFCGHVGLRVGGGTRFPSCGSRPSHPERVRVLGLLEVFQGPGALQPRHTLRARPAQGSSKHKSKQPKRSKPGGAQPDTAIATRGAGAVAPTAPPEGVTQEPTSDTTSPASPQKPSQAEASAPQASQLGAKSHTVAIVDRDPTSDTHDLDDSTLQKLRKEVLMRRASHASMHSTRLRPVVESPKVPAELDIFSEEHSAASIARATTVREKQYHSGHKQTRKRKSSSSRPASTVPVDVAFAGSKSECTVAPCGTCIAARHKLRHGTCFTGA
ncbi:uncharacterized protein LOC119452711 [Dermacentor silvarum]|uniref:uncharacterized protein LOC119452711 n=1 Tax=Dermacentor silvarum TaxID=543639 RepID=UPI002100F775|nr:uncharacterized protein LOC119452711 [Dermacentor silvarum]